MSSRTAGMPASFPLSTCVLRTDQNASKLSSNPASSTTPARLAKSAAPAPLPLTLCAWMSQGIASIAKALGIISRKRRRALPTLPCAAWCCSTDWYVSHPASFPSDSAAACRSGCPFAALPARDARISSISRVGLTPAMSSSSASSRTVLSSPCLAFASIRLCSAVSIGRGLTSTSTGSLGAAAAVSADITRSPEASASCALPSRRAFPSTGKSRRNLSASSARPSWVKRFPNSPMRSPSAR
mmetsp:Transcript_11385/g.34503  ORF Transcript_11385/g.34503 Transcript_11385/m.34503 type:complete len:242 (+) Transcript_11385:3728-4453(+)